MTTRLLFLILAILAARYAGAEPTHEGSRSIVEILVTAQRYDARMPWRLERPVSRAGYGVVIDSGRVITCEDLVRNAVLIEIRRPGTGGKIPATLLQADPRANSALLGLPDRSAPDHLAPVDWEESVAAGTEVNLIQFDPAGQMQTGDGRITEIAVEPLPSAPHSLLTFSVLTDLKMDRIGTPVFHNGRLVGLAMHYDEQSQTSLILPATILKTFLTAAAQPAYEGLATAGVFWTALVDPVKRRYYGLPGADEGVLVLRTIPSSGAAGVLRADDVILEWDGRAVDAQGYYNDPDFGRLSFSHLIASRRRAGETVPVILWRNRQRVSVSVRLDPFSDERALVPLNTEGRQAAYLLEGGLILRELTADYLSAYGPRWMITANPRLVNLTLTRAQFPARPGERVVILSAIVPDIVNKGYEDYRDAFAIRDRDGGIWRIATQSHGVDIVLDPDQLEEANRRISERYRIPQLRLMR
jgi:hypothetical protein